MARRDDTAEIPLTLIGKYPSSWEATTLGRACSLVTDGTHDSPQETHVGFPLVTGRCITGGRIDLSAAYLISESDHKEVIARSKPELGDILFANIGNSIGELARVETNVEFSIKNVALFKPGAELDSRYLKYYLLSPRVQRFIRGNTFGSAQPFIGLGTLRAFPLPLPPLSEQKAIATVLGALDDKIELDRRMNATLEAMARTLFQSWFVDFDPVRAKLDGHRPAGLDAATAALFPNEFEDSELGPIPKGWTVTTVGTKLSLLLGGTPSRGKPEFWANGTVAWINSGKTNEFRIIEPSEWITEEALQNSATKLLPRRTTVLAITGATLGQVSITEIECCANQSVVAVPASEEFPTEFIYPWIEENIQELLASQTGGAQQHINKGNVEQLSLLCPPRELMQAYLRCVKPFFDQIATNCFESRTLGASRDALLPKLLSGELRPALAT